MTKRNTGAALTEHAHGRSDEVRVKLRDAMKKIELEIDENDGIYPLQGGRLSLSEVCRRAGVHKVTLQGPNHRDTSKADVEAWIKRIKGTLITGRKSVRKTVTARANDWEAKYKDVARKFNEMFAIESIAKDKIIRELREKVGSLEAENVMLRAELSSGKVVRFPASPPPAAVKPKKSVTEEPRLVLIRGVPGSGKSTRASKLQGYIHFEADMYFTKDGEYSFDPDLLPAAHQWCIQKTRDALAQGYKVVVANVFANPWDVKPYIDLGYPYKLVQADGLWPSVHGVDPERVERMRSTWMSNKRLIEEVMTMIGKQEGTR